MERTGHSALAVFAGAALISASGVALADPAPTPVAAPAPVAARPQTPRTKVHAGDEVVCKTVVATGSRLGGTKICKTRADWYQESNGDRETMDRFGAYNPTVK
jgi:hypothetical protein